MPAMPVFVFVKTSKMSTCETLECRSLKLCPRIGGWVGGWVSTYDMLYCLKIFLAELSIHQKCRSKDESDIVSICRLKINIIA